MRTYGVTGMQEHLRYHLRLGEMFGALVEGREDLFKMLVRPAFALTVLAVRPLGEGGQAQANELTKEVYDLVNQRGEIYLTSTVLPGDVYAIRVVSANPKAEEKYVRRAFEILVEVAEEVRGRRSEMNAEMQALNGS
jgi:aromatic-L-amino-acid decarboxylase